jgi:hypothetical protein
MAGTQPPPPVKYFIAVLYHNSSYRDRARAEFIRRWGAVDHEGADHLFDITAYYEPEMGAPLYRRLFAFENLRDPSHLVAMKLTCNDIENELQVGLKRTVNCDAGYLDHNKVVLASAKEAGQKIYLDKGIYADLAGRYKAGVYQPFEWSFPDFKDGRYDRELLTIRDRYRAQAKVWRHAQSDPPLHLSPG